MYEQEKSEINILKSYLQSQIPTTPLPPNDILLSPNSVALKAAISGLDKELCRLEREERLVAKFTASANSCTLKEDEAADMEYVKMSKEDAQNGATADTTDDVNMGDGEWEEANPSPAKKHLKQAADDDDDDDAELLRCQSLSSAIVTRIANANVKVHTPLGAIALALHTALVALSYNEKADGNNSFRCTGVPDASVVSQLLGNDIVAKQTKIGGGGFALPVRELPRGELVPPKWEDNASSSNNSAVIAFRYKCGKEVYTTDSGPTNDATTMYLTVQLIEGNEVVVAFGTLPSPSSEKEPTKLTFPLGQYANLDGFQASKAKNGGGGVSPSLFYISLSELMFKFSSTFGLLSRVQKGESSPAAASLKMPTKSDVIGNPVPSSTARVTAMNVPRPNIPPDGPSVDLPSQTDPLRVMDAQRKGKHKDFEGDLLPGGPQPGGLHEIPPRGMGSQVGPNHPMFDRTFGDSGGSGYHDDEFGGGFGSGGESFGVPGVGGGMGMHPRFDYYGPPCGPTEPGRGGRGGQFPGRGSRLGRGQGRGGGRMPPGGFGNPNPDHMTPPGGDYFS